MIISAVLSGLPAFRIIDVIDICFVAFFFYYLFARLFYHVITDNYF